mmetsp:Transcript_11354/g.15871  ORF Transcript_11354/g.15871 Transcript_11354/m.15871 type:complete len:215 (-) Transcript_11354:1736-2380(-)
MRSMYSVIASGVAQTHDIMFIAPNKISLQHTKSNKISESKHLQNQKIKNILNKMSLYQNKYIDSKKHFISQKNFFSTSKSLQHEDRNSIKTRLTNNKNKFDEINKKIFCFTLKIKDDQNFMSEKKLLQFTKNNKITGFYSYHSNYFYYLFEVSSKFFDKVKKWCDEMYKISKKSRFYSCENQSYLKIHSLNSGRYFSSFFIINKNRCNPILFNP